MTVEEDIKRAIECMRKGGVILYPTDTVWGIGCDATNPEAVKKVYEIKKRDDSKALICLIDSADRMARYFRNVPQVAWDFIDAAMPVKPTTVILDDASGVAVSMQVAYLAKKLNLKPKRTIRVVAYMNEENGLMGGKTYGLEEDA